MFLRVLLYTCGTFILMVYIKKSGIRKRMERSVVIYIYIESNCQCRNIFRQFSDGCCCCCFFCWVSVCLVFSTIQSYSINIILNNDIYIQHQLISENCSKHFLFIGGVVVDFERYTL